MLNKHLTSTRYAQCGKGDKRMKYFDSRRSVCDDSLEMEAQKGTTRRTREELPEKRVWFPQTGGQKLRKLLFSFFFILNRTSGINVRLEARTHRLYCTAKNRRLEFLVLLIRLFWGDPNYNNNFELNYDVCNPSYGQYEHPRSTK